MNRLARGAVLASLYIALAGGLGMVAVGLWQYWAGHRAGVAEAQEERNAHWQGVIGAMVAEHAKQLTAQAAKTRAIEDEWLAGARLAGEALARERETTTRLRGDLAAAVSRADRVRGAITAAAAGGRTEAEDSVAAARERAAAIGGVLDEALRAHEQCSLELEEAGADRRALRAGWPRDAGERSVEIAP